MDDKVGATAPDRRQAPVFGDITFSTDALGYATEEVDAFLVEASDAVAQVIDRLRTAEARAAEAERRADEATADAADAAEADALLRRTIALAEKSAVSAVADAQARARAIVQGAQDEILRSFDAERDQMRADREAMAAERAELEALRVSVDEDAASLERTRAELRSRVRTLAEALSNVGDSPEPPAVAAAQDADGAAPAVLEHLGQYAQLVAVADAGEDDGLDAAFAEFFSDDVEREPSRAWMLAG